MGKKDKAKKKAGKGAEKTAEKTEKKLKAKIKKTIGEDDIESIIKAIEDEEKKRQEVKEIPVDPPSHRANLSVTANPDLPEVVFFGGEFYNGQKTFLNNDLLVYNIKRRSWTQIKSPAGPPPRCSHQAVITPQGGGQLWIFGGEYVSPSDTQFHHYKDLWCYHFASRRWEKISASGGPSARSGHRMVYSKQHLIVFGGFHDNLRDCKYFNDVHAFDMSNRQWKKLTFSGAAPSPRSGCNMFPLSDGRIVIFGGYCKEKEKKDTEKGKTLNDMFLLAPDKHDESMTKWRWYTVKQTGSRPSLRSGMASALAPNNKVFFFGGVQDVQEDDESIEGNFFNDLYTVHVENEKATWIKVELSGKKDPTEKKKRRRKDEGGDEVEQLEDMSISQENQATTVTVEEGAFTITSTVGGADSVPEDSSSSPRPEVSAFVPSPRFGSAMTIKQGTLYLFGGMFEEGDKQFTLKDFYALDLGRLDEWETLIESDIKSMEWFDEEDSEGSEDDSETDEDDMDTE